MKEPKKAGETKGYGAEQQSAPDLTIDATGLLCPLPVLRLTRALRDAAAGTRIELLATDPASAIDVPHFCNQAGHALLVQEETGGSFRYLVEARGGTGSKEED